MISFCQNFWFKSVSTSICSWDKDWIWIVKYAYIILFWNLAVLLRLRLLQPLARAESKSQTCCGCLRTCPAFGKLTFAGLAPFLQRTKFFLDIFRFKLTNRFSCSLPICIFNLKLIHVLGNDFLILSVEQRKFRHWFLERFNRKSQIYELF